MRAGLADEVLSIAGDADDLESRAFEDADYALANDRLILTNDDPDRGLGSHLPTNRTRRLRLAGRATRCRFGLGTALSPD
jgi:hypothetical protein